MTRKEKDDWLFKRSGCHIVDLCRYFGYPDLTVKVMSLDADDEKTGKAIIAKDTEMRTLYSRFAKDKSVQYRKGENRSLTGFMQDMIIGWVIEDLLRKQLEENGIEADLAGADKARVIDIRDSVNSSADLRIKVGDVVRNVELTAEFNNILADSFYIEKRVPALMNCWKNGNIWLYRDLLHEQYVMVDFATEKVKLHRRYHGNNVAPSWSKEVHRYVLAENGKKVRSDRLLIPEIISIVGCSIDNEKKPIIEEVVDKDSYPKRAETKIVESEARESSRSKIENVKSVMEVKTLVTEKPKPKKSEENGGLEPIVSDEEDVPADFDYGDGDFV